MKVADSSSCEICNVNEDAEHIIIYCVKYHAVRTKYNHINAYTNLKDMIQDFNINILKIILQFLKDIQYKI